MRRYGTERVSAACLRALDADMLDVRRLERMLDDAPPLAPPAAAHPDHPLARYLRPASQYAITFAPPSPTTDTGGDS